MYKILFLFLITILASCEKQSYPSDDYPSNIPTYKPITGLSMWGEFIVIDGLMYVDNHETGKQTVYKHFDIGKDKSSLRWGGSTFEIEDIIQNKTTYSFYKPIGNSKYGKFVLNGDTSKHYAVFYMGENKSIIEDPVQPQMLLSGSSRPFSGQRLNDNTIVLQIQEMEGSINGENCHYWTQLTLKKLRSW